MMARAATSYRPSGKAGHRYTNPRHRKKRSTAWLRHIVLLVVYEGAGVWATWPRFTWLAEGKLPATSDVSAFVWNMWWLAHQLGYLGNPFFTNDMAAPAGIHLGFSTLMPLAGWLMAPITVSFGPSASFTLLTLITPGLLCYAMYRTARLWINEPGAIVAGGFFGLSSMILWQDWYHLNIAVGTIFLPLTIEAAVRFRRKPHALPAVGLGIAIGGSILVNQESAVVAVILAVVILVPWLVRALIRDRALLRQISKPLMIGAGTGIVVASPQLIGALQAISAGAADPPHSILAANYAAYGVPLSTLFSPSPRLADFGLGPLASAYNFYDPHQEIEGLPTFGIMLSGLALLGAAACWRKRSTWVYVALWLAGAALALGTSLTFGNCQVSSWRRPGTDWGRTCHQYLPLMAHGYYTRVFAPAGQVNGVWKPVLVSNLMPYTWLVRIPGLAGMREADRFAIVGLIGAAMLAGLAVQWLSKRKITMPLIAVVIALGALEAGWSGAARTSPGYDGVMPTGVPRLNHFLSSDHSNSIVVDFPYGLRGGVGASGSDIDPAALLIATNDGHPRAVSYTSWVSKVAINRIGRHAFFRYLDEAERSEILSAADIGRARADLKTMHVGWVLMWRNVWTMHKPRWRYGYIDRYLTAVAFRHVKSACLAAVALSACHWNRRVWLYRYEPSAGGKAWHVPPSTSAKDRRRLRH
jgi:hypothetical protein